MNLETEATLQAEFYHACRLLGLPVILELVTPSGRVDAAILSGDKSRLLAIVEVKKFEYAFLAGQSAQIIRYKRLGVPVYGLWFGKDPHRLALSIQAACSNSQGVTLAQMDGRRAEILTQKYLEKERRKSYRLARFKRYHTV